MLPVWPARTDGNQNNGFRNLLTITVRRNTHYYNYDDDDNNNNNNNNNNVPSMKSERYGTKTQCSNSKKY
jgi:hypothetical protein